MRPYGPTSHSPALGLSAYDRSTDPSPKTVHGTTLVAPNAPIQARFVAARRAGPQHLWMHANTHITMVTDQDQGYLTTVGVQTSGNMLRKRRGGSFVAVTIE